MQLLSSSFARMTVFRVRIKFSAWPLEQGCRGAVKTV